MARKRPKKRATRDGLVRLDPEKVDRLRLRLGWSKTQLALQADLSRHTILAAYRADGVFAKSAAAVADALGVPVDELLVSDGDGASASGGVYSLPSTDEWEPVGYLGPWEEASNGLQFRVCKMLHRHVDTVEGRGMFYDLLGVETDRRETMRAMLTRHPQVAARVEGHRHLAVMRSAGPTEQRTGWWVVDAWVGSETLADRLENAPWPAAELPRLMREILSGLEALHLSGIVFRELAPSRVLLAQSDGRVVLTDFELAKLLDASPTVSAAWPDDAYRAPEVESGNFDGRADLFSWARILVRAATGALPESGRDVESLTGVDLPSGVRRAVTACLSPVADDRPNDCRAILKAIKGWK